MSASPASVRVIALERARAEQLVDQLVAADREVLDEKGDDYAEDVWGRREFLWEGPAKWDLSRFALADDTHVAGFWIASSPAVGYVHFHRVLVRSRWRGQGLYSRMGDSAIAAAIDRGARTISTFFQETNTRVRDYHERRGFQILRDDRLRDFLRETGREAMGVVDGAAIVRPDGTRKTAAVLVR